MDPQARCRPRVADPVNDRLERLQRGAAPVLGDMAEEPMLNLVPLARPRRQVADMDAEPRLIGELLQLHFPGVGAIAIAPAASAVINKSVACGYARWPMLCHQWRIDATAKAGVSWSCPTLTHASLRRHVIDPVGNRLPARVRRDIVNVHRLRHARRLPFPAHISEVSDQLLLLCVDREPAGDAAGNSPPSH